LSTIKYKIIEARKMFVLSPLGGRTSNSMNKEMCLEAAREAIKKYGEVLEDIQI